MIVLLPARTPPVTLFLVMLLPNNAVAADDGTLLSADDGGYLQTD